MKTKYKLETAGVNSRLSAVAIIKDCLSLSLLEAKIAVYDNEGFEADCDHPRFREMIDRLDAIGVKVFDYNRVQLPKFDGVDSEPSSYT